ncbi:MAG TPA: amidohydrolase family protein [Solirubrobacteraceae bacterium]|nr:amidohydrolase family protein [Solirubrobacteraceae bacterium]
MPTLELRNLGGLVTGRLGDGRRDVDAIRVEDGRISDLASTGAAETVVDCARAVAVPGLIDSHAHVVFGDWTPRQSALGWIESSMHGGVTMMMSASEVHLPGRPHDAEGVKALAITAQRAFERFRPGGVKVLGGALIIEPELQESDFLWLAERGVGLAKVGFGAFGSQSEAAPLVRAAQAAGFVVMNHTGGASIPDSSPVTIDDVLALRCDIIGHANGGPTALPDKDLPRLFDAPGAIQLVQAGNLRSSLRILELARERDALDRIVLATDTPTGTGVMPLGMIKTTVEVSSLGRVAATDALAMATGNNARVLRRAEGVLDVGAPADIVLLQAPLGGATDDPLAAIENGDIPGIVCVLIDGEIRTMRSRNTPAAMRQATAERTVLV